MMGRAAYQEPWRLLAVDPLLFGEPAPCLGEGGRARARALYRARACARHAAARDHAAYARPVPRRAGRARLPPPPRDRGGQARRRHRASCRMRCAVADAPASVRQSRPHCRASLLRRFRGGRRVLGVPVSELAVLALLILAGGVVTGLLAGLFGIGGGAHHRAGALRGVPRARRARRGAHAALRRHLARDHRADHDPLLRAHIAQGVAAVDGCRAALGAAGDRRRVRRARRSRRSRHPAVFKLAFVLFCRVDRRQAAVRQRHLADRRRLAGPRR